MHDDGVLLINVDCIKFIESSMRNYGNWSVINLELPSTKRRTKRLEAIFVNESFEDLKAKLAAVGAIEKS